MEMSPWVAALKCSAIANAYADGTRSFYTADGTLVAVFQFGSNPFTPPREYVAGYAEITLASPLSADTISPGIVAKFVDRSSGNAIIAEGTVGTEQDITNGNEVDCVIGAQPTRAGQTIVFDTYNWIERVEVIT